MNAEPQSPVPPNRRKLARERRVERPGLGRIRWKLHTFAISQGWVNARGTANLAEIQRRSHLSRDWLWYILRYPEDHSRVHFKNLARLCYGLNCQPGDVLEYVGAEAGLAQLSETYKLTPDFGLETGASGGADEADESFWDDDE